MTLRTILILNLNYVKGVEMKKLNEITFWPDWSNNEVSLDTFLKELLCKMWNEGECFNSKRPFGNSSWKTELYAEMVKSRLVDGKLLDGYLEECDENEADRLITEYIVNEM